MFHVHGPENPGDREAGVIKDRFREIVWVVFQAGLP